MALDQHPRKEFLVTGAGSYLQGTAAMGKFQTEVYAACKGAFKKHLPDLIHAIALPLGEPHFKLWPVQEKADGTWASIGLELKTKGIGTIWLYILWSYTEDGEPEINVKASVSCSGRGVNTRLWDAFLQHNGEADLGLRCWGAVDAAPDHPKRFFAPR